MLRKFPPAEALIIFLGLGLGSALLFFGYISKKNRTKNLESTQQSIVNFENSAMAMARFRNILYIPRSEVKNVVNCSDDTPTAKTAEVMCLDELVCYEDQFEGKKIFSFSCGIKETPQMNLPRDKQVLELVVRSNLGWKTDSAILDKTPKLYILSGQDNMKMQILISEAEPPVFSVYKM